MSKSQQIQIFDNAITIIKINEYDYISLTDMLKSKDGDFFVSDWLRNRNTIEFLSIWEEVNNPNFNCGESAIIKNQAWVHSYKISIKERNEKTQAIGIVSTTGRYWWTYAHKDIAFEFGMWISPKFKIYLIKEFQRLKEQEMSTQDRTVKRFLTKMNYKIHTDAIKTCLIPVDVTQTQINFVYADEADLLNVALFGQTAKERRDKNPKTIGNIRDEATLEQLIVLANMESINAEYIKLWLPQSKRLELLNKTAISQMRSLLDSPTLQKLPTP